MGFGVSEGFSKEVGVCAMPKPVVEIKGGGGGFSITLTETNPIVTNPIGGGGGFSTILAGINPTGVLSVI